MRRVMMIDKYEKEQYENGCLGDQLAKKTKFFLVSTYRTDIAL